MSEKKLEELDAVERRKRYQLQLEELSLQLETATEPSARGQILGRMGSAYWLLGRVDEMVAYGTQAQEILPDEPSFQYLYQQLQLYRKTGRVTPWDHDRAVQPYDDIQDILSHQGLSFDDFFEQSKRGPIRAPICRLVRDLARPGERILEAGCAAGGYYASLKQFVDASRYAAIDWTPAMVKRAKSQFPELMAARMDVRDLAFLDGAFPLVFSTDVLMHVAEWPRGLRELYRVASRALVLRIRTRVKDNLPTVVSRIGSGSFRVPYVINGIADFQENLQALRPAPAGVDYISASPEPMYKDLWQITEQYPEMLPDLEAMPLPTINLIVDLVIHKPQV